ncbi:MAG: hypothetical protein AAGJ46_11805 [Planctomycetota bacterium]
MLMATEESPSTAAAEPHAKRERLFPAHLAPIDRFLLDDDSPSHPMTYVIQMECRGVFDREAFEAALAGAVDRHPYTRAIIGPGKRGLLSWLDSRGERPTVNWGRWDEPLDLPDGEAIDIRQRVGLRVWVREDEERSRVVFQWHHSVSDGTGAFRFIGDALALYDQSKGGEKSKLLPLNPSLLRDRRSRMSLAYVAGDRRGILRAVWGLVRGVFMRRAAPLTLPAERGESTFPGFFLHTFSREETAALRQSADSASVMLNDLLVERMFQTMREWNRRHGKPNPRKPLRVMMPADLRESPETEMPAANMVSYNFLSRRSSDCDTPEALLRSVANETDRIKHAQTGKAFIDAISAGEVAPWAVPWLLRRGWCLATTVFTNNGDPARRMNARLPREKGLLTAGGVVVERFSGVPPLRPRTHVVLAAMTYGRQLTLSVRCDPNHFGDADSEAFLELLLERLRETITATTPNARAATA